jgi:hypothetical protein
VDASLADGPPTLDAPGLCGNQIIPTLEDRPNLYFVLDRSTSMSELLPGSTLTKYLGARAAIVQLLRAVGHRVSYGLAAFPWLTGQCTTGREMFSTHGGDPPSYAARGEDGPVLKQLLTALWQAVPGDTGGTPTAATLEALVPIITALEGSTFVVLSTDGEPNCNPRASCTALDCSLNQKNLSIDGILCDARFNCCDPQRVVDGPLSCVDGPATVSAIRDLASLGVKTYVIGMPGSEYQSDLLNQMAVTGGTARYVPVSELGDLSAAIMEIGVSVAISCDLVLDSPPPDRGLVNVYFDRDLVPADPAEGWAFVDDGGMQIRGLACERLMSGSVLEVQVVAGCPTVVY